MKYFFLLLLFSFLCLGDLSAQVGINNPTPSQALDVGGKIKVGDDEIAPVAGTIRYNRVAKTFEGYDGAEWSVFNPEEDDGSNPLPSGTVLTAIANFQFGNEGVITVSWYDVNSNTSFTKVPPGRTLHVSYLNFRSFGDPYQFVLEPKRSPSQRIEEGILTATDTNPESNQEFNDPNGFLLVVPSGGQLDVRRFNGSSHVYLRGFLQ
ncbi:hypothetical protein [Neolewinella persica]|uniref:hypothetical protein n=1 Tax=Neolewinella persica TaxID=70998 RepID=UPI00037C14F9|nr:hypothetical protein [Neolewinella persica]